MSSLNTSYKLKPLENVLGNVVKFPTDKFYVGCKDSESVSFVILQNNYLDPNHKMFITSIPNPVSKWAFDRNRSYSKCVGSFGTVIEAVVFMKQHRVQKCKNYIEGNKDMVRQEKERIHRRENGTLEMRSISSSKEIIKTCEESIEHFQNEIKGITKYLNKQAEKYPEYFI